MFSKEKAYFGQTVKIFWAFEHEKEVQLFNFKDNWWPVSTNKLIFCSFGLIPVHDYVLIVHNSVGAIRRQTRCFLDSLNFQKHIASFIIMNRDRIIGGGFVREFDFVEWPIRSVLIFEDSLLRCKFVKGFSGYPCPLFGDDLVQVVVIPSSLWMNPEIEKLDIY